MWIRSMPGSWERLRGRRLDWTARQPPGQGRERHKEGGRERAAPEAGSEAGEHTCSLRWASSRRRSEMAARSAGLAPPPASSSSSGTSTKLMWPAGEGTEELGRRMNGTAGARGTDRGFSACTTALFRKLLATPHKMCTSVYCQPPAHLPAPSRPPQTRTAALCHRWTGSRGEGLQATTPTAAAPDRAG